MPLVYQFIKTIIEEKLDDLQGDIMTYSHHTKGIDSIANILSKEEKVCAVIVGGSIAHKTEREDSDIDIMIVLSEKDYNQALQNSETWCSDKVEAEGREIFIDGKYISLSFIKDVAERGSEPSRYAFSGAFAAYSKIDGLNELIKKASRYQKDKKIGNIDRFWAQLRAWEWYAKEALKRNDEYLLRHSSNKTVLFAGRLILTHNEMLFPYHKWFMTELEKAGDKPDNFMRMLYAAVEKPDVENIEELVQKTRDFLAQYYKLRDDWPNLFIRDSELGWQTGNHSVEDI